jgi:hypothetical protein
VCPCPALNLIVCLFDFLPICLWVHLYYNCISFHLCDRTDKRWNAAFFSVV